MWMWRSLLFPGVYSWSVLPSVVVPLCIAILLCIQTVTYVSFCDIVLLQYVIWSNYLHLVELLCRQTCLCGVCILCVPLIYFMTLYYVLYCIYGVIVIWNCLIYCITDSLPPVWLCIPWRHTVILYLLAWTTYTCTLWLYVPLNWCLLNSALLLIIVYTVVYLLVVSCEQVWVLIVWRCGCLDLPVYLVLCVDYCLQLLYLQTFLFGFVLVLLMWLLCCIVLCYTTGRLQLDLRYIMYCCGCSIIYCVIVWNHLYCVDCVMFLHYYDLYICLVWIMWLFIFIVLYSIIFIMDWCGLFMYYCGTLLYILVCELEWIILLPGTTLLCGLLLAF